MADGEVINANLVAVEVWRRRRDAHGWVGGIACPCNRRERLSAVVQPVRIGLVRPTVAVNPTWPGKGAVAVNVTAEELPAASGSSGHSILGSGSGVAEQTVGIPAWTKSKKIRANGSGARKSSTSVARAGPWFVTVNVYVSSLPPCTGSRARGTRPTSPRTRNRSRWGEARCGRAWGRGSPRRATLERAAGDR